MQRSHCYFVNNHAMLDYSQSTIEYMYIVEEGIEVLETAKPKKKSSKTAKKFAQNQKPHTKPSKTNTMVTSGAYRANYTNTNFIKVFVNVMDLSEAFVSFSFCRLLSSLFTLHLNMFLAAFPLLVKKFSTIHNCFFRYWRRRHVGNRPNDRPGL